MHTLDTVLRTEKKLCTGCSRCVRECPLEVAIRTYKNKQGKIKSIIDYDKCILCGRCVKHCNNKARIFSDDTERFFDDLAMGKPISLMVAPSVATYMPEYKRLFTYLKQKGVRTIFDVSLGADICTWAHVRHLQATQFAPMISQPCPSIVLYIQKYRPELIFKLSPIHSPMGCTSIYMKEYCGITDSIAAITPCIAKTMEFNETGLVQYNVTINNLLEYIIHNNVELPEAETEFDHERTGLGSLFPLPGGLRSNLSMILGADLHVLESAGIETYDALDAYSALEEAYIPHFYDVLNCNGGCNNGSALTKQPSAFEVSKKMYDFKKSMMNPEISKVYEKKYEYFDNTFSTEMFKRIYTYEPLDLPVITEADINKAFQRMGKKTREQRNIDCSACGSNTCYNMARKISMQINIPGSCIYKVMDDVKHQHLESLQTQEKIVSLTKQRETDERIRQITEKAADELKNQLNKINLIVAVANIGLYEMPFTSNTEFDLKNTIYYDNNIREMLGYEDERDFPNVLSTWHNAIHPNDRVRVFTAATECFRDITGKTTFDVEYRLIKKNGDCVHHRTIGFTIREEDGRPIRSVGATHDITDHVYLNLEMDKQRAKAEEANRSKSVLLSHVSHEVRTPLNAILGTVEIEMQKDNISPEMEASFYRIYEASRLLLRIVNDLLDFAKIEAGKLEITPASYNFPSLINDAVQVNMRMYESKGLHFTLYVSEDTPCNLLGDELRIKQVINNILSNAFKYTDQGTVTFTVEAEKEDNTCILILRISDTGQGMTTSQIQRLFDEYTRFNMNTNRSITGTGLGMAITHSLLKLMDGDIQVESTPQIGTKFTIKLPQIVLDDTVCGPEIAERLRTHKFTNLSRAKIARMEYEYMPYGKVLIVDDVETNLYVAKGLMMPYGLQIDTVINGYDALDRIKNGEQYDIIFMDHMMPVMDGIETTRYLRLDGYHEPIIALTANAVTGQAGTLLSEGFDAFISKPIDIRELDLVLNRYIRDKQPNEVVAAARKSSKKIGEQKPQMQDNTELMQAAMYDIGNALVALDDVMSDLEGLKGSKLTLYHTLVHGIKSALLYINEEALSNEAKSLELAAKNKDMAIIENNMPSFMQALRDIYEANQPQATTGPVLEAPVLTPGDDAFLHETLLTIQQACRSIKKSVASAALNKLNEYSWPPETTQLLNEISVLLLHGKFKQIVSVTEFITETKV